MTLFWLYKKTMTLGKPAIMAVLKRRLEDGKEDPQRIRERYGQPSLDRPDGPLMWIHVASVGEAQSMLPMARLFLDQTPNGHVLMTSITRTAAELLDGRLPERAFHQYLPVDRPKWVRRFLDHWRPDIVLWAESELWPCMVMELNKRRIPAALLNARMSPRSFAKWSKVRQLAENILSGFAVILTQTQQDYEYYTALGGRSVVVSDNIKYCASPLPYDAHELDALRRAIGSRPCWLYASTHKGEEELALEVHAALCQTWPDLLTIVVPRHPERAAAVESFYQESPVTSCRRTHSRLPRPDTGLFVVDTLGELGLFYRAAPIVCVGRSFSDDGGGGHNPLEPALLTCAVLHGPNVQNLQDIYDQMDAAGASISVPQASALAATIARLIAAPDALARQRDAGYLFAGGKSHVLNTVIEEIEPLFLLAHLPLLKAPQT